MNTPPPEQPLLATKGFDFAVPVEPGGYRWWYLDAFSEDGRAGMTIILFVGSVFSPYYFRARQRGVAPADHHCSANVIFYGPDRKRWAMTERGHNELTRNDGLFQVGPTSVSLQGDQLILDIRERCVPFPTRLTGQVVVDIPALEGPCFSLDRHKRHRWWPMAPSVNVSVDLRHPRLRWSGAGYLDTNGGTEPLEAAFESWHWQRSESDQGRGEILYDALWRDGGTRRIGLSFDKDGRKQALEIEHEFLDLATTSVWRVGRKGFGDRGKLRVDKTYEDTPFYARSRLAAQGADGSSSTIMHESLDLNRFTRPWVQRLLPFRMPRIAR